MKFHIPHRMRLAAVLIVVVVIGFALWSYSDWITDRSVLTNSPCAPPCWQGIEPGTHINRDELVRRLNAMPNVASSWQPTGNDVAWYWKLWLWKEPVASNKIVMIGDMVKQINLSFDFVLTTSEVVGRYGVPDVIYVAEGGIPEAPYVSVDLCYPRRGVIFSAQTNWRQPVLEPTTRVYNAYYSAPSESLDAWLATQHTYYQFQPWPGYGSVRPVK